MSESEPPIGFASKCGVGVYNPSGSGVFKCGRPEGHEGQCHPHPDYSGVDPHLLDWKRYGHLTEEEDRPRIEQLIRDRGTRDVMPYASAVASLERHLKAARDEAGDPTPSAQAKCDADIYDMASGHEFKCNRPKDHEGDHSMHASYFDVNPMGGRMILPEAPEMTLGRIAHDVYCAGARSMGLPPPTLDLSWSAQSGWEDAATAVLGARHGSLQLGLVLMRTVMGAVTDIPPAPWGDWPAATRCAANAAAQAVLSASALVIR